MAGHSSSPTATPGVPKGNWAERYKGWLLLAILALGTVARFFNQAWDEGTGQHPDERHVLMCTYRLEWPKSLAEYFDEAHSPLNPRNRDAHFFAYGTLPSAMLRATMMLGGITRPEQMTSAARVLSALVDTATIALVYALASMLYRRNEQALLAALFYALAVLPIQEAHFFVVDPFANMFVALALVGLARAWRSGSYLAYMGTGIALGLAVSCKISVATFGLPVGLIALIGSDLPQRGWRAALGWATARVAVFCVALVVTVRVALPDAFSGFWPWQLAPRWVANMREVVNISTGVIDMVFTRQFYGRIPLLWPWWNMVAWGLGLALGLAAWAGWLKASWQLLTQRRWAHAIPVLWIATVFFHLGFTYQSTLRYFLPIYGCLCVLAAGWLLPNETATELVGRRSRWRKAGVAVSIVFTLGWALGFLSIYTKPHTRVEASRWIYENIPRESVLACEHWDDWLPLSLPGDLSPSRYRQIELPLYVADNSDKRGELLAKLNNAQYIIVASQKLRDSIPRMPHRYPFTISYYEGLEDGSLGFDRVAEFHRDMNFFGWKISTRPAEEAFSVYDHPPVVIYKKASRYDPEALVHRFNSISLDGVSDTREPIKKQPDMLREEKRAAHVEGKPESAILLTPERWAAAQKDGTWSEMFSRTSFAAHHPVMVWVALLVALQAVGWALVGPLFRTLPDRGAGLARLFALMFSCWILWLLASVGLVRNDRIFYWVILAFLAALGGFLTWRQRRGWQDWWRESRWNLFRVELTFWLCFAFFLWVRSGNPDLWHPFWGGEKPMEMSFLYGVLKSETFPPLNPWYAGGFLNYYYFGFVLCGAMIKALGVLPEVGFNLCLATFFALAAAATLSAARALRPVGNWLAAWTATAFVMFFGNLFELRFIWNRLVTLGEPDHELHFPLISDAIRAVHGLRHVAAGTPLSAYVADLYWVPARAIGDESVAPVTEFPYWSFVYGDLHPHLIALGFTLAVIALLVAWVKTASGKTRMILAGVLGLTLGFFWVTNAWDWPTYAALSGLVMFLTFWRPATATLGGFIGAGIKSVALFLVVLGVGYLAFLPYHQHYVAGYGSFERWSGHRTALRDYLFIYGFFLFILGSAWVMAVKRGEVRCLRGVRLWFLAARRLIFANGKGVPRLMKLAHSQPTSLFGATFGMVVIVVGLAGTIFGSLPVVLFAGVLLAADRLWHHRGDPIRAVPALLVLIAFGLSLLVEFVVLVGDIGRMNTVFKFYYQVWVAWGLASALALPDLLAAWPRWKPRFRWPWAVLAGVLVAASCLYVVLGTRAKILDRFADTPRTLDGLAFAEVAQYTLEEHRFSLAPDLHAIRWLQDNVIGSPVLLEMNTGNRLYSWGSRFSVHTGLPSVVGWSWHQRQQQAGLERSLVDDRIDDVQRIYRTSDPEVARRLMEKYAVQFVVIGEVERIYATPEGLEKFEHMGLTKSYDAEGVRIYRVPPGFY